MPWINSVNLDKSIESGFDLIFLASGTARPNLANKNLELQSTLKLLSNFDLPKATKLIYISSGAIYGECKSPKSELAVPIPITDYGEAKFFVERELFAKYPNQLCVLRVGNVINEEDPYGIVFHLASAVEKRIVKFLGAPTDCRDYLEISDFLNCVRGMTELNFYPRVMNVGSGMSVSLKQIAFLLKEEFGDELETTWEDRRMGDLAQTKLNVDKIRKGLQIEFVDPIQRLRTLIRDLRSSKPLGN